MALFAAHLARIVITILLETEMQNYNLATYSNFKIAFPFIVSFHQMLNVIISSVHFYSFVLLISFTWLGHRTNNNIGASLNGIVLQMTKTPSRKVSEVLFFIIPQVNRIYKHWEALVAYRSRR